MVQTYFFGLIVGRKTNHCVTNFQIYFERRLTREQRWQTTTNVADGSITWLCPWVPSVNPDDIQAQWSIVLNIIKDASLIDLKDGWSWLANKSCLFSTKSMRRILEKQIGQNYGGFNYGNSWISGKVNFFFWRLMLDRLPCRTTLLSRGLHVDSVKCEFCETFNESTDHLFTKCSLARHVWCLLTLWCKIPSFRNLNIEAMIHEIG
ncbi:hypothetical protein E3N88_18906 [Mikania micrantha]|uniref:Reverse transcriptase zinc-binding domain-containing protein n=1 Tax=Mikania micrantha TaxID=192012 RepID=A0A5N6NNC4_9ASTR|nr:hypothetical protein E3N88_18906 [Mikania micrantha]